jgi:dihydropteroate synthase
MGASELCRAWSLRAAGAGGEGLMASAAFGVMGASAMGRESCELWGVLNVTPDSFSDGGKYLPPDRALAHARRLLAEGADVIDVGGASSRPRGRLYGPGAAKVEAAEELRRVLPVVQALAAEDVRVSIDTTHPEVGRAALAAGARIVNDVSCAASAELLHVVAEHGAQYVVMHTRGDGAVEPPNTQYADVVADVCTELVAAAARAEAAGIARERLWLDPGLGFAKTAAQSVTLLAGLPALVALGLPVLCAPSRKGFIADLAPRADGARPAPEEREPGTLAAVTSAVLHGARAVRVHDVAAARQAVLIAAAIRAQARSASAPC